MVNDAAVSYHFQTFQSLPFHIFNHHQLSTETATESMFLPTSPVVPDGGQCGVSVATEKQHISSMRSESDSCGKKERPWNVESMVGQRINISLIQLISSNKTSSKRPFLYFSTSMIGHEADCAAYAKVVDEKKGEVAAVCLGDGGSNHKMQSYLSNSNNVEIIYNDRRPADALQFLFAFEGDFGDLFT